MKKSNHELHKELWFWLAENPGKKKSDWPGWEKSNNYNKNATEFACFACSTGRVGMNSSECPNCPIDWRVNGGRWNFCNLRDAMYYDWNNEIDLEKRSILAEVIASMEWRERP